MKTLILAILISANGLVQAQDHSQHGSHNSHDSHHGEHESYPNGFLGDYSMTQEASGTSWQPAFTPMEGRHFKQGDWTLMTHGYVQGVYNKQGGPRGNNKLYTNSMAMIMAQRPWYGRTLGLRAMLSLDPIHGRDGYPLLFQTGETADGVNPLIDRQHPHDLLMELAATYSQRVGDGSIFGYFGFPGEPALGPPAFMHRFSGVELPEAPLSHHWIDSTHITFGVATVGYILGGIKAEASIFTGREPDRHRWDFEKPKFDSQAGRLTFNPNDYWSFQTSYGRLESPEQLQPHDDVRRWTASAMRMSRLIYGELHTTLAFGRNGAHGEDSDAWLLESTLRLKERYGPHTLMGRWERVDETELLGGASHHSYGVTKISAGYIYDILNWKFSRWGLGFLGSIYQYPHELETFYGKHPSSYMLFVRGKLL